MLNLFQIRRSIVALISYFNHAIRYKTQFTIHTFILEIKPRTHNNFFINEKNEINYIIIECIEDY